MIKLKFSHLAAFVLAGTFFLSTANSASAVTMIFPKSMRVDGLTFDTPFFLNSNYLADSLRLDFTKPINITDVKQATSQELVAQALGTPLVTSGPTLPLTINEPAKTVTNPVETMLVSSPAPTATPILKPTTTPAPTITPLASSSPTLIPTPTTQPIPTSVPTAYVAPAGSLNADKIFDMINAHRTSMNLAPLQKDDRTCTVANSRAPEIGNEIASGHMHQGLKDRNLPYWNTENIISMQTEEQAVNWWLNDYIHKKSIEGDYKYSCVACSGNSCAQEFTNFQSK